MSKLKKKIKRVVVKSRVLSPLYNVYLKYVLWKRCTIAIKNYGQNNITDIPIIYSNNFIVTFRGDNNFVKIGKGCNFKNTNSIYVQGDDNVVVIGDNVTFDSNVLIVVGEGTKVNIGSDCIFCRSGPYSNN